jgi:thiol-disulfide isomerase/thioredoxin
MSTRAAVLGGLVAGALLGAFVLAGLIVVAPPPGAGASPTPILASASPPPTVEVTPSPGGGTPSGSPEPIGSAPPGSGSTAFHIGQPAPPLVVPQLGGGTIDLAALRGQAVWVNFMQTVCPPCVDEFPLMNGFAARYADDGLVVIAVDVREDPGVVAAFAQRLNATFPIGLDDGKAQDDWDAFALPIHFWIDREGIVRDGSLGGIGPDIMADGVSAILPGVEVTP